MNEKEQMHISLCKEKEGTVDLYMLAPGVGICYNQIYTNNWTKGDSTVFSERMLILNFCLGGRCDVSLAGNRYAIVSEHQVCVSTVLPTKDFYYPGRLYEGVQIYIDRSVLDETGDKNFLLGMGINAEQIVENFCKNETVYLHRMNDEVCELVKEIWKIKEEPQMGMLRYLTIRLLYELMQMPNESETGNYYTRSQISIVRETESLIMQDLSRRITAKEMAERFGISESSFKLYVKGILGESYLEYFRNKRMEKAARLLEDTDLKVIEIASAVGYENQGKFARVFAKKYGAVPLEYRRMKRGKYKVEKSGSIC